MLFSVAKFALFLLQFNYCSGQFQVEMEVEAARKMRSKDLGRKSIMVLPGTAKGTVLGQFGRSLRKSPARYIVEDKRLQQYFDIDGEGKLFLTRNIDLPAGHSFHPIRIYAIFEELLETLIYSIFVKVTLPSEISVAVLSEPPLPLVPLYDATSAIPNSGNFTFSITQISPHTKKDFLQINKTTGEVRLHLPAFHPRPDCNMFSFPDYVTARILLQDVETLSNVTMVVMRVDFKHIGPPTNVSVSLVDGRYHLCLNHPNSSEAISAISGYLIRLFSDNGVAIAEWFSLEHQTTNHSQTDRPSFWLEFAPTNARIQVVAYAVDYAKNEGIASEDGVYLPKKVLAPTNLKAFTLGKDETALCWSVAPNSNANYLVCGKNRREKIGRLFRLRDEIKTSLRRCDSSVRSKLRIPQQTRQDCSENVTFCVQMDVTEDQPYQLSVVDINENNPLKKFRGVETALTWSSDSPRLREFLNAHENPFYILHTGENSKLCDEIKSSPLNLESVVSSLGDFYLCWSPVKNVRDSDKFIVEISNHDVRRQYRSSAPKSLVGESSESVRDRSCVRFDAEPNVPHKVVVKVVDGGGDGKVVSSSEETKLIWLDDSSKHSLSDRKKEGNQFRSVIRNKVPSPVNLEAVVNRGGEKLICFEEADALAPGKVYTVEVANGEDITARYETKDLHLESSLNATGLKPWSNLERQCVLFDADWGVSYRLTVKVTRSNDPKLFNQSIETELHWNNGCPGDVCGSGICLYDNNPCSGRLCSCDKTLYTFKCPHKPVCEREEDRIVCDRIVWPRTAPSGVAEIACPSGVAGLVARRYCLPSGEWGHLEVPLRCSNRVTGEGEGAACKKMVEDKILRLRDVIVEKLQRPHSKAPQEMSRVLSDVDEMSDSLILLDSVNETLLQPLSDLPRLIEKNFDEMILDDQIFSSSKQHVSAVTMNVDNQTAKSLLNLSISAETPEMNNGRISVNKVSFPVDFVDGLLVREVPTRFTMVYYDSPLLFPITDPASLGPGVLSMHFPGVPVRNLSQDVNFTVTGPPSDPLLAPRCVFLLSDGSLSSAGMTTLIGGGVPGRSHITCSTNHLTSFSVVFEPTSVRLSPIHDKILTAISVLLTTLSVIGLAITIFFYTFFRMLSQDNQGRLLVQFCCSLLLIYLIFLLSHLSQSPIHSVVTPLCAATAVMMHYLVLSCLFWMLVEALNIYQLLIEVFTSQRSWFLRKRMLLCWGAPMLLVGITVAADYNKYISAVNAESCTITHQQPLVYYLSFFVPGCAILIFNSVIFVMVMRVVMGQRRGTRAGPHGDKTTSKQVVGVLTVMTLLGMGWLLGVLQVGPARVFFAYLFVLVNASQGLVVFFMRCFFYPPARLSWLRLMGRSVLVRKDTVLTSDQGLMRTYETGTGTSSSYRSYSASNGHGTGRS